MYRIGQIWYNANYQLSLECVAYPKTFKCVDKGTSGWRIGQVDAIGTFPLWEQKTWKLKETAFSRYYKQL